MKIAVVECSECKTPYVLRWSIQVMGMDLSKTRTIFTYQPDCKHGRKKPEARIRTDENDETEWCEVAASTLEEIEAGG